MKGREKWAKEYASRCDNESGSFLSHQLEAIRMTAYLAGMNSGLLRAARISKSVGNIQLEFLILSIGLGDVEQESPDASVLKEKPNG